jgi:mersacidin/lichenicidin family type 2 lantibiotic
MKLDIVRAWKDEAYRRSLSEEQLHMLPANPAGETELSDADLSSICGGGIGTDGLGTWGSGEIVNGQMYSFALSCKHVLFSVTIITGTNSFHPVTVICIKGKGEA